MITVSEISKLRNFVYKQDLELKSLGLMTEHLITHDEFGMAFKTHSDVSPIIRIAATDTLDNVLDKLCAYYVGLKRAIKLFVKK